MSGACKAVAGTVAVSSAVVAVLAQWTYHEISKSVRCQVEIMTSMKELHEFLDEKKDYSRKLFIKIAEDEDNVGLAQQYCGGFLDMRKDIGQMKQKMALYT